MIAFERRTAPGAPKGTEQIRVPYLLHAHSDITGDDLQDAVCDDQPGKANS